MTAPSIDRALLRALQGLAQLHIPAEHEGTVRARLQRILEAFAALDRLPADAPAPPPETGVSLRADVAGPVLTPEQVLANAPRQAAGCFLVPRVVDA